MCFHVLFCRLRVTVFDCVEYAQMLGKRIGRAIRQRLRLQRGPGADLAEARTGREIGIGLCGRQLLRAARVLDIGIEKGLLPPADTSRKARKKLVAKLKSQLAR